MPCREGVSGTGAPSPGRTPRAEGQGPQCRNRSHLLARRAAPESPARRSQSAPGHRPPAPAPGGGGQDPQGGCAPPAARASPAPARSAAAPAARAGSSPHSCRGRSGGPACCETDGGVRDNPRQLRATPPCPRSLTWVPLCPCSPTPAPRRLLWGVSGGPPPRCPSPPRPRPDRLPGQQLSATAGGDTSTQRPRGEQHQRPPSPLPWAHLAHPHPSPRCRAASARPSCLRRPSEGARGCRGARSLSTVPQGPFPGPPQLPMTPHPKARAAPSGS